MKRTAVLDIVGLSGRLLGADTPNLSRLAARGTQRPLQTITPAVTCSVQATFMTGSLPRDHGVVANGWYFRDLSEVWLWRQSGRLFNGERIWEAGKRRDPAFRCAKIFWWYNMYDSADIAATPRPMYPADGRKLPDCWTHPPTLRDELNRRLGTFPLFNFWGPTASIESSRWIADAARIVCEKDDPTLTLVYLPHLDYCLQKLGPDHPEVSAHLRAIDTVAGSLIDFFASRDTRVIVLSEYGITPVSGPVHINRALREAGLLSIRDELGLEVLDAGASPAFAVADHQIAHVYVNDPSRKSEVRAVLERLPGVDEVLDDAGKHRHGLDHPRSGDLVALSAVDRWFTYYYWLDDRRAPDFARSVDIHRKPGYDPVELFLDPTLFAPKAQIAWRLLKKKLGQRTLMDVIPLDATLVRGSHGRITAPEDGPVFLTSETMTLPGSVPATGVKDLVLQHVFDDDA